MVVTKLLPTPPLPLATAITFFTLDAALSFAEKSKLSFLSAHFLPQVEQSCVQFSSAMMSLFLLLGVLYHIIALWRPRFALLAADVRCENKRLGKSCPSKKKRQMFGTKQYKAQI
jgi:hypothetical protein